ncbi:MAG: hypothetical protein ACI9K5_001831 [Gammaproteobacteria bacterium]|jgi:hypothetical protein
MLTATSLSLLAAALCSPTPQGLNSLVVHTGETFTYNTDDGTLRLSDLTIEAGGVFRAQGGAPLILLASGSIRVNGTLDVSGFHASNVATLNTGNVPELGATGGPSGGVGGTGSSVTTDSTPAGTDGMASDFSSVGGGGGETGYADPSLGSDSRRPGGGGGGVLAADQPESDDAGDPSNQGLIVGPGLDGASSANGALTGAPPPLGGAVGQSVFIDGDPTNDFWGRGLTDDGHLILGELSFPVGGRGGGAGGDAVPSTVFPHQNWTVSSDEKGGAGGGGGGLAFVQGHRLVIGSSGRILADGGSGGLGENTLFLNSIGGNGGGGSGGFLVLRASEIDLTRASEDALSAVGGVGAQNMVTSTEGGGGNGGPGVIQLHTPRSARVRLAAGTTLADFSRPDARSLLLH